MHDANRAARVEDGGESLHQTESAKKDASRARLYVGGEDGIESHTPRETRTVLYANASRSWRPLAAMPTHEAKALTEL